MSAKAYIGIPDVSRLTRNIYLGIGPDTGKRLYNGVELAALPETKFPHLCILSGEDDYTLYSSDQEVVYSYGMRFTADTDVEIYSTSPGDLEWHFDRETVIAANTVKSGVIIWANYDIYRHRDELSLTDQVTGETYSLYIENGKLIMEHDETIASDELSLVDHATGETYSLYVESGKLRTGHVNAKTTASEGLSLVDHITGKAYSLYIENGKLIMESEE